VAIEGAFPWSDESMVSIWLLREPQNQDKNDLFQFLEIFALLLEFFHIPPELAGFIKGV
jgi:hypothetical protein